EASQAGGAGDGGTRTARRADDVSREAVIDHAAAGRADRGGADARFLPLVVCEHVDAGPVRNEADARVLLSHRRRSVVAGRSSGRASPRLQLPDAVVDLDPRGLPWSFPPLPTSAPRRVEGAEIDSVCAGVLRRRLGPLLRADDDRGGL